MTHADVLSVGSVCTGYGGLDLALSAVLDTRLAWVADPAPAPTAILTHHYPHTPNLGDLTTLDWTTVPPVDVLTAGFPCQDLSYAGHGAGITEGTRSGLWLTIAHAVGVLRPRLLLLENVAAIVARRPGLDIVLADLARLGFDAEWTCVRASDVGAPHRRERWFLLAWPADPDGPRLEGHRLPRAAAEHGDAAADPHHLGEHRDRATRRPPQRHPARPGRTTADPTGIGSGEPADPAHPLSTGRRTRTVPGRRSGRTTVHPRNDLRDETAVDWGRYGPAVTRWENITGRRAPRPTDDRRRLSPPFVEWLMGLPPGWVTAVPGLTRNQQLHALGNGVVPAQAQRALHTLLPAHRTAPTGNEAAA
ncbi:DNA cytosine methyltransferase [Streptosporangium algeriense]|uniref:DNA (cytosine-5-)-methyltransferase n=1 Tax=Streptosporangium algeriense TaxID=1682748 RepID=A0ABW3DQI3_9ACTN